MTDHELHVDDELRLIRLVNELLWRMDHGRVDTVYELFAEDGVLQGPRWGEPVVGRSAVREWGRASKPSLEKWSSLRVVSNLRLLADGPDRVEGTFVQTVYLDEVGSSKGIGSSVPALVADAALSCVRTDEGWRIASIAAETRFARAERDAASAIASPGG